MVRCPEADLADAIPSARVLYQSRLTNPSLSDHVPIKLTTYSDREGKMKAQKVPHWAATDPFFKGYFEAEVEAALKLQGEAATPFQKLEAYKDALHSGWRAFRSEKLSDDHAKFESDRKY